MVETFCDLGTFPSANAEVDSPLLDGSGVYVEVSMGHSESTIKCDSTSRYVRFPIQFDRII